MTPTETIRVFVNGHGFTIPRGGTVIDAVRAGDADQARAALAGERAVTDSRGLPVALDAPVSGGTVLRVVSARQLRHDPAVPEEE